MQQPASARLRQLKSDRLSVAPSNHNKEKQRVNIEGD
jgi:hypothetical protein